MEAHPPITKVQGGEVHTQELKNCQGKLVATFQRFLEFFTSM